MKKIIICLLTVAAITISVPFIAERIVVKKVEKDIDGISVQLSELDPTASITHTGISYSIFQNIVRISDFNYHSRTDGIEVNLGEIAFTPVDMDNKEHLDTIKNMPDITVAHIKDGWIQIRDDKLGDAKQQYNFFAGDDGKVEFSTDLKGFFNKRNDSYSYDSSLYVEKIGTLRLSFLVNGISDKKGIDSPNSPDFSINNLKLSLSTNNTRSIITELLGGLNYVENEDDLGTEIEKLSHRMEFDESLIGFAQPVKDIHRSYVSGQRLTLTLSTESSLDAQTLITVMMMGQSNASPAYLANLLGIKITSSLN